MTPQDSVTLDAISQQNLLEKTYNAQNVEQALYSEAEEKGMFKADPSSSKPKYCIMMPPPNVTGALHMGHALTFTLQDIFVRFKRMQGFDVLWQPGTDHAGIATQMMVEKDLAIKGTSRTALGRSAFLDKVWEWKHQYGSKITTQLRRLGASTDWSRERFTMDEGLSKAVRKVFVDLFEAGLIYKDKRLVNWDPKLKTAVSDLEVDNVEVKGFMYHIAYPFKNDSSQNIVVATTRPETMFGDCAIAVNPKDERYTKFIGQEVIIPLTNRAIPIIADDYSDPEKGTGAVKITPAHDFNDFEVGKRHNLEPIIMMDENAALNENVPAEFSGLDRYVARKAICAKLEELGFLVETKPHTLSQPTGERSGTTIEPWLMDQWYVNATVLAKPAFEAVAKGDTAFIPGSWKTIYDHWLTDIQPWCISRQLWWGHQIPAWYAEDGTVFVANNEDEAQSKARAHFSKDVPLTQDEDVLDTWFSSALWPFSTLGWPEKTKELEAYYTTDLLVTGHDIIFFWVARMMMMGLYFTKKVPFKHVYIHALIRDEKGQKMSKTKGNVIDPLELIDEYGADALRFSLALGATPGQDMRFGVDRVSHARNFITKIWNAARFCQMNGCAMPQTFEASKLTQNVNMWIYSEYVKTAHTMKNALENHMVHEAASTLYHFVWGTYCDWYLEMIKPVFQNSDAAAIETKETAAWMLSEILKLAHPLMPFVSSELFKTFGNGDALSLMMQDFPNPVLLEAHQKRAAETTRICDAISHIRSLRGEFSIPPALQIELYVSVSAKDLFDSAAPTIKRLARLSEIVYTEGLPSGKGWVESYNDGYSLFINLSGKINVDDEKKRNLKEMDKAQKIIEGALRKLNNPQFMEKADPFVIDEQKETLKTHEELKAKLENALERLEKAF